MITVLASTGHAAKFGQYGRCWLAGNSHTSDSTSVNFQKFSFPVLAFYHIFRLHELQFPLNGGMTLL